MACALWPLPALSGEEEGEIKANIQIKFRANRRLHFNFKKWSSWILLFYNGLFKKANFVEHFVCFLEEVLKTQNNVKVKHERRKLVLLMMKLYQLNCDSDVFFFPPYRCVYPHVIIMHTQGHILLLNWQCLLRMFPWGYMVFHLLDLFLCRTGAGALLTYTDILVIFCTELGLVTIVW